MQTKMGEPLDRIDGRAKVTGQAIYSAEHPIPGVVYAALVTSSIPKGAIASIDTRQAAKLPGVLAILTHENAPRLPGADHKKSGGPPTVRVLHLLQDNVVQYANQPIAVAVAETLEAAAEAASDVRVKYAPESHRVSLQKGMADAFTPEKAGGGGDPATSNRGDLEAGIASGAAHVDQLYSTPFQMHNPMEPHATIALWDRADHLTLFDATQGVFTDRARVAQVLGLKPENVRVVSPFLGGGFGSKGPTWSHVILAAMAARQVNRPVKLALSRMQMFGPVGMRAETAQTVTAAAQNDGTLTALRHNTVTHTSSFDQFVEAASLCSRMLYSSPANSTTHQLVRSDIGTPSFMRAPGEAPGTYALECAMDELAYQLKMDPIALRLKNYAAADPENNKPWSSKSLKECYRIGAERFGWNRRTPEPRSMADGENLIGLGMASAVYPTRRSPASAKVRLDADGTLHIEAGTQDLGTGTYTIMTQIAADELGIPVEKIRFRLGDTDLPQTPVSGGSQTAASTGSAVRLASSALREKIVQLAITDSQSPLSGIGAQDVVFENGKIASKTRPTQAESLQALLSRRGQPFLDAAAEARPGNEKEQYSMYAFGAQFAEVHVDADLGSIKVKRMAGVFGAGRILNAKTARSQLMGGMVWGLSMALQEHGVIDERLGRFVNNNLAEYHVPVHADMPEFDVSWVQEDDSHINPIGAKGIGEIGITGSVAAIANAIYHATGKRVRDLPITLDKLV